MRAADRSHAESLLARRGAEIISGERVIDLYYWPTLNGCKISILLHELEQPYNLIPLDIGKGDQFKTEFVAINPNGLMPAIVDSAPSGRRSRLALSSRVRS